MARSKRRLVPEVVQSSAMDCGPAALKAYVEGHGVSVSYGRLREACQTDVDGTAIETLQAIAVELGVPVEQVLLPKDLVLLEEAGSLPCIAVTRLPNGNTHFAIIWSLAADVAQVMDPASGRRWMTRGQLLHELYEHAMSVPAEDWREWAGSEQGRSLVVSQLSSLGIAKEAASKLVERAAADPSWRGLASLDAAARAVRSMVDAGACKRGREAEALLTPLLKDASSIPKGYWSARDVGDGEVEIRGAVLLRPSRDDESPAWSQESRELLSKALIAARDEAPARPALELWRRIREDGLLTPAVLIAALFGAASAIVIEALLFRSLLELAPLFGRGAVHHRALKGRRRYRRGGLARLKAIPHGVHCPHLERVDLPVGQVAHRLREVRAGARPASKRAAPHFVAVFVARDGRAAVARWGGPAQRHLSVAGTGNRRQVSRHARHEGKRGGVSDVRRRPRANGIDGRDAVVAGGPGREAAVAIRVAGTAGHQHGPRVAAGRRPFDAVAGDRAAAGVRRRVPVGSKYSNSRRVSSLHLSRIDYIENREAA